jgi:hypothetical protein
MQSEMSVEIDGPLEEVFERFASANAAEWSLIVVEDEVLEETPDVVGTTFRTVTEERGRRMDFAGVVTRHDPPRAHAVRMVGKQFDIEALYLFEDIDGRTRLTQQSTVNGKGFFRAMFLFFGWMMRRSSCDALEQELTSLKRLIEAGDEADGDES